MSEKTADELMSGLEANPDFLKRQEAKEQRRMEREKRVAELERPILEKLRSLGYELAEISEATRKYAPFQDDFVSVLLDAVKCYSGNSDYLNYNVLEMIIRALGAAANPFDGRPLVDYFDTTRDPNLRWVICNTVAIAKLTNIDDWIKKSLSDPFTSQTLKKLGFKAKNR